MQAAFTAGLVAVVVAVFSTPPVKRLATWLGAVDAPGGRRVHATATPRMGGLAIAVAYGLAVGTAWALDLVPEATGNQARQLVAFAVGCLIIVVAGIVDDARGLGAKRKLMLQVAAAVVAWLGGCQIGPILNVPGVGEVDIGTVGSLVISICWVVGFVNAINLVDGLDGLAAGIVFLACVTNIAVAAVSGNALAAVLNAALAGAVLGFLYYNFNPATVFMGDTGSMFLGFALGTSALMYGRQKESTLVSLLVPIIALGLPFADVVLAMFRRMVARRSIFAADRGHIHHLLIDLGLTHRRAVLLLYGCSVLLCAGAVGVAFGREWQVGAAIVSAVFAIAGLFRFAGAFDEVVRIEQERRVISHDAVEPLRDVIADTVLRLDAAETLGEVRGALELVCQTNTLRGLRVESGQDAFLFSHGDGPFTRTPDFHRVLETAAGDIEFKAWTRTRDQRLRLATRVLLSVIADQTAQRLSALVGVERSGELGKVEPPSARAVRAG